MSVSFEIFKMATRRKGQSQFFFNIAQNIAPGLNFVTLKGLNGHSFGSKNLESEAMSLRHPAGAPRHARPSRAARVAVSPL